MEKLCLFCKHFSWDRVGTSGDYSEYTGGDDYGGASCGRGHYSDDRPYDEDDFRNMLLRGVACKDWAQIILKPVATPK